MLSDADGVVVVDARILVGRSGPAPRPRPPLRDLPYPSELERHITLADGTAPSCAAAEDGPVPRFFSHVTDEDLRLRFFQSVRHFSHEFIARLTQMDYARSRWRRSTPTAPCSARCACADANYEAGEYGILVRSDLKGPLRAGS